MPYDRFSFGEAADPQNIPILMSQSKLETQDNIKSIKQEKQLPEPNLDINNVNSILENFKLTEINCDTRKEEDAVNNSVQEADGPPSTNSISQSQEQQQQDLMNGTAKTPFIIGVAGGSASGKSTVCRKIMEKLGQDSLKAGERRVTCISQDSFYRRLEPAEQELAKRGQFNFDHPDALDDQLMYDVMMEIAAGRSVEIPIWDFITHSRTQETLTVYPADVVLVEGILVFFFQNIRELFHMKLFVEADDDTRLARRGISTRILFSIIQ